MSGNDASTLAIVMLRSPVLVDEIHIANQVQIVNNRYIFLSVIALYKIVTIPFHQEHQILAYQFVGFVYVFGHQIEDQMPTPFAAQVDNRVKVFDARVVVMDLEGVTLDVMAGQFSKLLVALAVEAMPAAPSHRRIPLVGVGPLEIVWEIERVFFPMLLCNRIPFLLAANRVSLESQQETVHQWGIVLQKHDLFSECRFEAGVNPTGIERTEVHGHYHGLNRCVLRQLFQHIIISLRVRCAFGHVAQAHGREVGRNHCADFPVVAFSKAVSVVRRLAQINHLTTVGHHLTRQLNNVGMFQQVLLEEPLGIDPIHGHKQHCNDSYAYQQLLHGQNWK